MRYSKVAKIGSGSYGKVYNAKCDDSPESPNVALKEFFFVDDDISPTTLREISILKCCDHPNILHIMDILYTNDKSDHNRLNMITPLYKYTLGGLYKSIEGPLPTRLIESLTYQLTDGIRYLHSQGFIHRDLKPQNIYVNPVGNDNWIAVIGDFGLARRYYNHCEPLQMTHEVVTLWYRAPEVLLGQKKYTTSIDIWSLGTIIAEMVLKKPLLVGDSEIDQLYRIFALCGTPTEAIWNGVSELPDYKSIFPKWNSTIDERFKSFDETDKKPLVDLIKRILILDPQKRMNSINMLYSDIFYKELRVEEAETETELSILFNEYKFWQPLTSSYQLQTMFDTERPLKNELSKVFQNEINHSMIVILLDWLVDVSEKWKLLNTTHHRAVSMMYDYIDRTNKIIIRKELQLIGIVCLCMSGKLEEIYPPDLEDYIYVCDNTYTREELIKKETEIVKTLDYKFIYPMSIEFLRIINSGANFSDECHTACKFLLELSLQSLELVQEKPSTLAACITYKCMKSRISWGLDDLSSNDSSSNDSSSNEDNTADCWTSELELITRMTEGEIISSSCWKIFEEYIGNAELHVRSTKNAVYRKYEKKFFGVAKKIFKDNIT